MNYLEGFNLSLDDINDILRNIDEQDKLEFDYNEDNVFIEKTDTFENFKDVIARKYEVVFVLCGGEEGEITEIINSLC